MKVCVLGGAGLQPCVYAAVQYAALQAAEKVRWTSLESV
jgi:hypothetical protein